MLGWGSVNEVDQNRYLSAWRVYQNQSQYIIFFCINHNNFHLSWSLSFDKYLNSWIMAEVSERIRAVCKARSSYDVLFACRKQYSLYSSSGQNKSSFTYSQLGRFWIFGSQRRRSSTSFWWTAALLQHSVPTVNSSTRSRRSCLKWQVRKEKMLNF